MLISTIDLATSTTDQHGSVASSAIDSGQLQGPCFGGGLFFDSCEL